MPTNPLKSLADYSRFVTELLGQPNVKYTTVAVWSESPYTGIAEGEVLFTNGLRLRHPNLPALIQELEEVANA